MKGPLNILIINQYSANKGDRAVLYALVRLISEHRQGRIVVSSHDPSLWDVKTACDGAVERFVPWGWDYVTSTGRTGIGGTWYRILEHFRKYTYTIVREMFLAGVGSPVLYRLFSNPLFVEELNRSDLVISTGGHHITTLLSIDAISEQIFDMAVTIGSGKKLVIWSQSIGPLDFTNPRNERYILKILRKAGSIFVREEQSKQLLADRNILRPVGFTYETVISMNSLFTDHTPPSLRENVTGISVYSTKSRSREELEHYISVMASLADHMNSLGIRTRFFPMELRGSKPDDRWLIGLIRERCANPGMNETVDADLPAEEHLRSVASCRYFIGHKTHSIIFALTAGTPLIAIAYHPKSSDFMKQYGMSRFCIDEDSLSVERIIPMFDMLKEDPDPVGKELFSKSRGFSEQIRSSVRLMLNI